MRRTKAEAEQTRRHILNTALQLFDEKGYLQTSLSAIANQARVSRGAIYGHFANKEEILTVLAESQLSWLIEQNIAAIAAPKPWQALANNFISFFQQLSTNAAHLRFFRILHQQKNSDDPFGQLRQHYDALWRQQCRDAVTQGKLNGEISADADPEYLLFHITALLGGLIELYLYEHDHTYLAQYTVRTIETTMRALQQA